MSIFDNLNDRQIEAVKATEGPVLILAGAGSGKTKALTHRIAYLIREKKINPSNILAVTFTNKAAKEMASRVQRLINNKQLTVNKDRQTRTANLFAPSLSRGELPLIGTFHSICVRILRKEIEHLGYSKNFTIYDDYDSLVVIKKVIDNLEIDSKKYSPQAIRGLISSAKSELVNPKEYQRFASGFTQEIASKVYFQYEKVLQDSQALDFDDLIMKCVEIFEKYPEVLERYQELFRYIHVDEYQDTNHAQYRWTELLARKYRNIFVIGDDFQAIYSWRGANFQNILDFERDYPDAKIIKLEQNYRSTKTILEAANNIIKKNERRSEKTLWTKNSSGELITIYEAKDEKDEAEFVVRETEKLKREGISLKDIVVLYRTNVQSRSLEEVFLKYNIPYKIVGGVRFYQRKEIKDILAYLKIIESDYDEVSFERILNIPPRGIGKTGKIAFRDFTKERGLSFLEAISHIDEAEKVSPKTKKGLKELGKIITEIRTRKKGLNLPELIDFVVKRSGYFLYLSTLTERSSEGVEGEIRKENIKELLSVAYEYSKERENPSLADFLEEIALMSDIDNYSLDSEAVTLMTLHNAKGLEFRVVFIVGMEEGLFPHSLTMMNPMEIEEERRLCYVGVTRAMEKLYLLYASFRRIWGEERFCVPSRFLSDIPPHLLEGRFKNGVEDQEGGGGTINRNFIDRIQMKDEI